MSASVSGSKASASGSGSGSGSKGSKASASKASLAASKASQVSQKASASASKSRVSKKASLSKKAGSASQSQVADVLSQITDDSNFGLIAVGVVFGILAIVWGVNYGMTGNCNPFKWTKDAPEEENKAPTTEKQDKALIDVQQRVDNELPTVKQNAEEAKANAESITKDALKMDGVTEGPQGEIIADNNASQEAQDKAAEANKSQTSAAVLDRRVEMLEAMREQESIKTIVGGIDPSNYLSIEKMVDFLNKDKKGLKTFSDYGPTFQRYPRYAHNTKAQNVTRKMFDQEFIKKDLLVPIYDRFFKLQLTVFKALSEIEAKFVSKATPPKAIRLPANLLELLTGTELSSVIDGSTTPTELNLDSVNAAFINRCHALIALGLALERRLRKQLDRYNDNATFLWTYVGKKFSPKEQTIYKMYSDLKANTFLQNILAPIRREGTVSRKYYYVPYGFTNEGMKTLELEIHTAVKSLHESASVQAESAGLDAASWDKLATVRVPQSSYSVSVIKHADMFGDKNVPAEDPKAPYAKLKERLSGLAGAIFFVSFTHIQQFETAIKEKIDNYAGIISPVLEEKLGAGKGASAAPADTENSA